MTRQEKSFHLFAPVHVHSLADKAARECVGAVFLHWVILDLVTERIIANLQRSPGPVHCSGRLCERLAQLRDMLGDSEMDLDEGRQVEEILYAIVGLHQEWQALLNEAWSLNLDCVLVPLSRGPNQRKGITAERARRMKAALWQHYRDLQAIAMKTAFVAEHGGPTNERARLREDALLL